MVTTQGTIGGDMKNKKRDDWRMTRAVLLVVNKVIDAEQPPRGIPNITTGGGVVQPSKPWPRTGSHLGYNWKDVLKSRTMELKCAGCESPI